MKTNRKMLIFCVCLFSVKFSYATAPFQLQLGQHTFEITQTTARGTPVINMWKAQMPINDRQNAAGFPVLNNAEHHLVWAPRSRAEGAYNHYACLIFHNGHFYAMWGNHEFGEDGPGQRILYSISTDAITWTPATELFAAPGPVLPASESGIHLKPDRWVKVEGKLYAVVFVGTTYPIARQVTPNCVGEPFLLKNISANQQLPSYMNRRTPPSIAEKIEQWYIDNDVVTWWARSAHTLGGRTPSHSVDNAPLIETFSVRSDYYGKLVFYRDNTATAQNPSYRLYVSFEDGNGGYTEPYPTNIPDIPSRAEALRLPDGHVLLAGNQTAFRFDQQPTGMYRDPLTIAVSPDGKDFTKVFALRTGAPPTFRFSGITGRGAGQFSYPSMIVHNGKLYVLYSVNKEDMAISIVPLSAIR